MKRLTAKQVAAELDRLRVPYLIDMERADAECDTEDYEYNEHVAELLTKAIWLVRHNPIESPDERRKRFEEWRLSQGDSQAQLSQRSRVDGGYQDVALRMLWACWNAAIDFGGGCDDAET